MLDYGFARSPGGPCSDFQGRGRHGRGITSRALIGGAEYSHFFLNPLAVGSHEEGLPIPHAGAASLCPETAFHNPLAKEYDSDDDLTDSPPDSPGGAMLSFLSFPRAYDLITNGAKFPRPPSSSNKNANTISYNKGPISLAHRKVNVHSTGVALSSTMDRTAPAPPLKVKNGSSPQRMEVNGPISGAKPLAEPTPPELKPQLGSLEPSVERPSLPSEPHAPHTPPLISRDATAATAPWRWCKLGFPEQQQEDQQRRQYDETIPDQPEHSAAGAALSSHVSIDGTGTVTQVQEDEGQKLLQLDKEEHWQPLVPRDGETPLLPQTPQLQDQPQRLLPKHCAPSHAPTEASCSSVTPLTRFASGCAHAAVVQSQIRNNVAGACDASFTATGAVVGSCGSSSSSQATPARHIVDTAVTVVSSPNASCTPGALGATSSSPTNNATVAKREVGLGHFSFGRHSSVSSNGHNSRWVIVDGPPCSISGLAMTRAIIRQLGLLPPGLSTAPS
ncbi:hypothetical protein Vretimale_2859 [Volvox reticuliferus]|uniref:Uncharacterized protein n=1 Tax=Volvox reticuliferus TaxID=1737510 RepID=A0A8J4G4A2_9CHLO|nr:hypothetical protein Vretifemale_1872 [Volvox reticuliferus]GIL97113.1 hypothetical protein Vretimale_2859 [Volvox reticuliferus]